MNSIVELVDLFWGWTGYAERFKNYELTRLPIEPGDFPHLSEIQNECASLINQTLSDEEVDAFLTCMAIDNEYECILDECNKCACDIFLIAIISKGVSHPQSMARWQVAELLRKDVPGRKGYLTALLSDEDPYVRKRACNVAREIMLLDEENDASH